MTNDDLFAIKAAVDNAIAALEAVRVQVDRLTTDMVALRRDNERLLRLQAPVGENMRAARKKTSKETE